jgi:hypothetical protein
MATVASFLSLFLNILLDNIVQPAKELTYAYGILKNKQKILA